MSPPAKPGGATRRAGGGGWVGGVALRPLNSRSDSRIVPADSLEADRSTRYVKVHLDMTTPRLELRQVTKRLRSGEREITVVDRIDLAVAPGEFVAVLGPSGSGKSTLLGLAAGLDRPSAGEVLLDGRAIQALDESELARLRRGRIGFVFQSFQLLGNLTALENVLLPLEIAGVERPLEAARAMLVAVGLEERGHHYPTQLSGGEQQRVALARAFATEPALLLADEPTGNLDGATGAVVLELLTRLRAEHGTTLVLVTHDPEVAARADRRIHLRDGRIERSS
jgi:putative ABC transport system ATP-binding protein